MSDKDKCGVEGKCPKSKDHIELQVLRKMRLAFGATLHMLECARDDLKAMGDRMERLRCASEQCRKALDKNNNGESKDVQNVQLEDRSAFDQNGS
jgi:hypothetical protein